MDPGVRVQAMEPHSVPERADKPIRVALVDDYQMIADVLKTHIAAEASDMTVALTATSWAALLAHPAYPADVTVLNLHLGDGIRIDTKVHTLLAARSQVVIISRHMATTAISLALHAGALSFVPKSAPASELITAIRAAAAGRKHVSSLFTHDDSSAGSTPQLGSREHLAIVLYAAGRSTREVALEMGATEETVKSYIKRARSKFRLAGVDLGTKILLRNYAIREGWLEQE